MKEINIDIFKDNEGEYIDCIKTYTIPRVGDIISVIDRTSEQNPDNTRPGGTDIITNSEVKRVEIAYCKYGNTLNTSYIVPLISIFI